MRGLTSGGQPKSRFGVTVSCLPTAEARFHVIGDVGIIVSMKGFDILATSVRIG
jgi:hypothetical protein